MVAGTEVPVIGSDSIKWIDLTIPSSINHIDNGGFAPPTADSASATYIDGDDSFYLIRIHMAQSNVLEIFKLSQEFPHNTGLRLSFSHPLSAFALVSAFPTKSHYLLYTVTISGIAYFIKLSKDLTSIFSRDELIELDARAYSNCNEPITCMAANLGCLLLGRNDGSVTCFQLGSLHQTAPGFVSELRDDSGDQIVPFVSSIFLRRILHPGVYHNKVLRSTFLDYSKHWTDNEFQSLTVDGLKKEILSLGEHESTSGAVGLIRTHSVSLFRSLENTELLTDGLSEDLGDLASFGLDLFNDNSDREILFEVLRCVVNISQQLGKTASFIFYESFVGRQSISSEEIIPRLLKILGAGYGPSTRAGYLSGLGSDVALEREQRDHKNLRKFSVDMLLSLHDLCKKAASWRKILDVIESYLQFLVPKKFTQNSGAETLSCLNNSILVQASCQIAKVMFEYALDILLFVSYLMSIGGQTWS
ncbi:hypothetical protein GOBAR_AA10330 [Gossypium barbadense]|uniref:Uncharacterized protein n=1 Tax=Gossypium barbadense TaxID=3634 RepID=A0A2P5Y3V4_GOSBA|nr:hypothetical protein GOBAR_AA10330 [Gossypium barbadense]